MELGSISQATEKHFNFAQYINAEVTKPADSSAKRARYNDTNQDVAELSRLFKPIYDEISNFLPELKVKVASSISVALSELQNKFRELIMEKLSEYGDSAERGELNLTTPDQKGLLGLFAGGLHNAIELYIALAKVAYKKLAELCPNLDPNFDRNLENLLKNNRHASSQLAKIHGSTLKLVENENEIASNQLHPYTLKQENFSIHRKANDANNLYLLPTIAHLNQVISLTKDPNTPVKSYGYGADGKAELKTQTFSEINKGSIMGCPIFGATRQDGLTEVKLENEFFDNLDRVIKDIVIPERSAGGIIVFGQSQTNDK